VNRYRADVAVLGAGLQGAGIALELALRGVRVVLVDQDPIALNRASLRNEGKIHLGFIYANDRSLETASLQVEGALHFRRILARWTGPGDEWLVPSTPFHYLVAHDSVVAPDQLAEHYAAVERRCLERLAQDPELDYLGERPESLVRPLDDSEIAAHFDPQRCVAGFATAERAVDTAMLASAVRSALAEADGITFLPSHTARTIFEEQDGLHVQGVSPDGPWIVRAAHVVNATWERRPALDRHIGIPPPDLLLHRLKFRVIGRVPPELHGAPSVSMVLGRYGDIVIRADGTAYLSWYPAALRGWTNELEPPESWDAACRGEVDPLQAREIAAQIQAAFADWYPATAGFEAMQVDAGAIVALGRSDVDDENSGLHDRSRIGVTSYGRYHSVDTGKLTTAPLFAIEAADRVEAHQPAFS
jgi:glycine/D-amino acid oxidase-like deaminating enzyme